MRRLLLAIFVLATANLARAADYWGVAGSWAYSGTDAVIEIHLEQSGACYVKGSTSPATQADGVGVACFYAVHWPCVYLYGNADSRLDQPRVILVIDEMGTLRIEGDPRRPFHRVDALEEFWPATDRSPITIPPR